MVGFYAVFTKLTKDNYLFFWREAIIEWFEWIIILSWWFLSAPLLKLVWSPKWESSYQVEGKWETKMKDLQNFKFQFSGVSNSDILRWCNSTQMRMRRVKLMRILWKGASPGLCWRKCNVYFSITNEMFAQMTSLLLVTRKTCHVYMQDASFCQREALGTNKKAYWEWVEGAIGRVEGAVGESHLYI